MSVIFFLISVFFFFSSRRRHTRCLSDWSSDVCSSDLLLPLDRIFVSGKRGARRRLESRECQPGERSEERRVGKECRSRWSPYHEKKKVLSNTSRTKVND